MLRSLLLVVTIYASCISAAPVDESNPAVMKVRDRVRKAIAYLRSAKAIGEFAINTPFGLIPVKDINEENMPDVFRFRREFEEVKKLEAIQKDSEQAVPEPTGLGAAEVVGPVVEGSGEGSGQEDIAQPAAATVVHAARKREVPLSPVDEPLLTGN